MLAIMMVLLLPPSESCRMRVSFESLQYGTIALSSKIDRKGSPWQTRYAFRAARSYL